jgi:glycine cleavage system H protein
MASPSELKYTQEHEWVKIEGDRATIGITHHAQDQLGDIVFVELPEVGRRLTRGEVFGVVESVKTVSDLYAPLSGTVVEANPILVESDPSFRPETINSSPYGDAWMLVLELSSPEEQDSLLDSDGYEAFVAEAG